jgi:hypothetical protein
LSSYDDQAPEPLSGDDYDDDDDVNNPDFEELAKRQLKGAIYLFSLGTRLLYLLMAASFFPFGWEATVTSTLLYMVITAIVEAYRDETSVIAHQAPAGSSSSTTAAVGVFVINNGGSSSSSQGQSPQGAQGGAAVDAKGQSSATTATGAAGAGARRGTPPAAAAQSPHFLHHVSKYQSISLSPLVLREASWPDVTTHWPIMAFVVCPKYCMLRYLQQHFACNAFNPSFIL